MVGLIILVHSLVFLPPLDSVYVGGETKSTLTFFSEEDIAKLHSAVDSANSMAEFEYIYYNSFADIIDEKKGSSLTSTPDIMAGPIEEVTINYNDPLEGMSIESLKESDLGLLKNFAHTFTDEYTKYPVEWMSEVNPIVILFVKKISFDESGDEPGGVSKTGILIYDIDSGLPEFDKELIHHELAHLLMRVNFGISTDPNWPAKAEDYRASYSLSDFYNYEIYPEPGFVTGYARTKPSEDIAETYSYLFTKEGYSKLQAWTIEDEMLRAKVDHLKSFIKRRVSKMDDAYFEKYILGKNVSDQL